MRNSMGLGCGGLLRMSLWQESEEVVNGMMFINAGVIHYNNNGLKQSGLKRLISESSGVAKFFRFLSDSQISYHPPAIRSKHVE